ncbi:MAG: dihydropteroate synthase [Planctomycetota bacterium]|nr:dihydropteroate synthase [Planctomycetota bacterium]
MSILSSNKPSAICEPSTTWSLRDRTLSFGKEPLLMGILNVTPDSFSDGGNFYTVQSAVDRAKQIEDEGAGILDLGGESTRPYSLPVDTEEELKRVVPILEKLQGKIAIPISIDTTKSEVATAALELGASIINDVSGLEADPQMVEVAVRFGAGVCAMHRKGTPQTMQDNPHYDDVVEEILSYLRSTKTRLIECGILPEKICLDPGIGFGKTHEHNLQLLQHAVRFHETESPILIGHSRKGFIAKILGNKDLPRTMGTVGVSMALALQRIQVLRIHDVAEHRQAIQCFVASLI